MTLQPYRPEELDQFALVLLELAASVRNMANRCREHGIDGLVLHDKKARRWCAQLGEWVQKAQADLEAKVGQAKAR
jgi:hypothetical protein